jgi:hypothetical protein
MVQSLWQRRVGAMVPWCHGALWSDLVAYLLPGHLRRGTQPLRLSGCAEFTNSRQRARVESGGSVGPCLVFRNHYSGTEIRAQARQSHVFNVVLSNQKIIGHFNAQQSLSILKGRREYLQHLSRETRRSKKKDQQEEVTATWQISDVDLYHGVHYQ